MSANRIAQLLQDAGILSTTEVPSVDDYEQARRILKRRIVEAERLAIMDLRAAYGINAPTDVRVHIEKVPEVA